MSGVRRAALLGAVTALLAVLAVVLPGSSAPARAADSAPLEVRLTGLSPSVIPTKGRIRITGTVRNITKQTWRGVHVYPLTSYDPITSDDDLADAAASAPTAVIGSRLVDLRRRIGTLRPGASVHFRLRVPVEDLQISHQPGVYWLAVHALGSNREGADEVADGRARTFIPLVDSQVRRTAPVSLVLPMTDAVRRTADGAVANAKALARSTLPGGRLARLLDFARSAGSVPITWLVDPAVVDAVQEVTNGNSGIDLAKAETATPSGEPSAESSDESGASAGAAPQPPDPSATSTAGPGGDGGGTFAPASTKEAAKQWLKAWTEEAKVDSVLAVPYGDTDVSALPADRAGLLKESWRLGHRVLSQRSISSQRAIAPADGYLRPEATHLLRRKTTVLLQDHDVAHQAIRSKKVRYLYADTSVASGGPGPGDRTAPLQLRQRLLAEGAIDVLGDDARPLVVELPDDWRAGSPSANAKFFRGLDVPWLTPTSLPTGVAQDTDHKSTTVRLDWPKKAADSVVPALNVAAAARLSGLARTTSALIDDDEEVPRALRKIALTATSDHARAEPVAVRIIVDAAERRMQELLDDIQVEGTDFVVLSGGSGALTVSVHNGLNQPIRLGLRSRADDPLVTFDAPSSIKLGAGSRATVRLHAHAGAVGVHEVTLTAVTSTDRPVGAPLVFSVRTSQIGRVFWMVLAGGMVILVLLIARRVRQRIRARKASA